VAILISVSQHNAKRGKAKERKKKGRRNLSTPAFQGGTFTEWGKKGGGGRRGESRPW